MLTDVALRALIRTPPDRQTDIPDAAVPGLSARITPKGRVTWSYRLRVAGEGGQSARGHRPKGQQYRLTLGSYPTVSIRQARIKAGEYGQRADAGTHPVRALEREAVGKRDTIENLADTFLEDYAKPNLRSWRNAQSALTRHIVPAWGKLPVDSIEERDVARLLTDVAKGEVDPETNKRVSRPGAAAEVRKWGSLLYSWAQRSGLASRNPFLQSRNPLRQRPRQRFLDMDEVRAVWKASDTLSKPWKSIIQLLLLTGCRTREIAHARWSWINLSDSQIVIPASAYKTERPFLVALSPKAKAILEDIERWDDKDAVFSTDGGETPVWGIPRKIVNKLHTAAEKGLGRKIEHFVIHDLRRTVRTHLSRLKVTDVVAELVLGHALRGVAGTYNVYDFESEKREALVAWSSELVS